MPGKMETLKTNLKIRIAGILIVLFFGISAEAQRVISFTKKASLSRDLIGLIVPGINIENGVDAWSVQYLTTGLDGLPDTASGLVIIPDLTLKTLPALCFQHGTVNDRTDVPSNLRGGWQLVMVMGGLGYLSFAPDYIGMGTSRGFHPYLHAETEARAAHDLYIALEEFFQKSNTGVKLTDQLFITGYSQGGHASMAYHRFLEDQGEIEVTAASHMSGPYSLSGVMKGLIFDNTPYPNPAFVASLVVAFNDIYKMYPNFEHIFKSPYAALVQKLYEEKIGVFELNDQLKAQLTSDVGANIASFMFQDSILEAAKMDDNHPLNVALKSNDVYDWAPESPTLILYCDGDETVDYKNSIVADSVMKSNGAPSVFIKNAGSGLSHSGCVMPAFTSTIDFFKTYKSTATSRATITHFPKLEIFPNPATAYLILKGIPESGAFVRIFDLSGRIVRETLVEGGQKEISVSQLSPGMYWMQVSAGQYTETRKVVIQSF
jgi:pimeloyl-ACP methyl ester carboxylesterase